MTNFPAVRAAHRALKRNARLQAQILGAELDHAIDFGEFSDNHSELIIDELTRDIIGHVAMHFNMPRNLLEHDMAEANQHEFHCMVNRP